METTLTEHFFQQADSNTNFKRRQKQFGEVSGL